MSALDELNDARRALREIANVPFVTPAAYQIAMRALAGKYREEGMSMKKDTGMQCATYFETGLACNGCGQCAKFKLGDLVRKTKGSQWSGLVVGTYSTELTAEGYAVESSTERGSVQIYPAAALEMVQPAAPVQAQPQVGCEGDDGLLRVHAASETCDVCQPVQAQPVAAVRAAGRIDAMHKGVVGVFAAIRAEHVPADDEVQREQFECAIGKPAHIKVETQGTMRDGDGDYENPNVQYLWELWQLAQLATTQPAVAPAAPQDDPRDDLICRLRKQVDDAVARAYEAEQKLAAPSAPAAPEGTTTRAMRMAGVKAADRLDCFLSEDDAEAVFTAMLAAQVQPVAVPEAVLRNAARYEWLRHGDNDERVIQEGPLDPGYHWLPRNARLGAMIDEAMAADAAEGGKRSTIVFPGDSLTVNTPAEGGKA